VRLVSDRGSVTRSGCGSPGAVELAQSGLMFGRAAAHRAAVRTW